MRACALRQARPELPHDRPCLLPAQDLLPSWYPPHHTASSAAVTHMEHAAGAVHSLFVGDSNCRGGRAQTAVSSSVPSKVDHVVRTVFVSFAGHIPQGHGQLRLSGTHFAVPLRDAPCVMTCTPGDTRPAQANRNAPVPLKTLSSLETLHSLFCGGHRFPRVRSRVPITALAPPRW